MAIDRPTEHLVKDTHNPSSTLLLRQFIEAIVRVSVHLKGMSDGIAHTFSTVMNEHVLPNARRPAMHRGKRRPALDVHNYPVFQPLLKKLLDQHGGALSTQSSSTMDARAFLFMAADLKIVDDTIRHHGDGFELEQFASLSRPESQPELTQVDSPANAKKGPAALPKRGAKSPIPSVPAKLPTHTTPRKKTEETSPRGNPSLEQIESAVAVHRAMQKVKGLRQQLDSLREQRSTGRLTCREMLHCFDSDLGLVHGPGGTCVRLDQEIVHLEVLSAWCRAAVCRMALIEWVAKKKEEMEVAAKHEAEAREALMSAVESDAALATAALAAAGEKEEEETVDHVGDSAIVAEVLKRGGDEKWGEALAQILQVISQ